MMHGTTNIKKKKERKKERKKNYISKHKSHILSKIWRFEASAIWFQVGWSPLGYPDHEGIGEYFNLEEQHNPNTGQ